MTTAAQVRLLRRAVAEGGACYVRGAEVRVARALPQYGELRDDGAFGSRSTNSDGERWWFQLKAPESVRAELGERP